MASSQKPQARSVLISLSAQHHRPEFPFPERRILLEPDAAVSTSKIKIGRTSRRDATLEAKEDNCFFDSPVMSRDHAEIRRLYIKDVGSMHGTYKNSSRLSPGVASIIEQGDTIKFGIDIRRSSDLFPPCTMEARFEFDHLANQAAQNASGRPSYRVPDGYDSESSDEDSSESEILPTVEKLRKIDQIRSAVNDPAPRPTIDLTIVEKVGSSDLIARSPENGSASRRTIDLTLDDAPSHTIAVPSLAYNLPAMPQETIVIDEEDHRDDAGADSADVTTEPIHNPPGSSQPEFPKTFDVDAPHDEDEESSPAFPQNMSPKQDLFDSDEMDSDYSDQDQNPLDYPEEEMSHEELSDEELSESEDEQSLDSSSDEGSLNDSPAGCDCESHADGEGCPEEDHGEGRIEEDRVDQCDCDSLIEEGRVDGCECNCHGDDENGGEEDRVLGDFDDDSEDDYPMPDSTVERTLVPAMGTSILPTEQQPFSRQQMFFNPLPEAVSGAMAGDAFNVIPEAIPELPPLQGPQQLLSLGLTHQNHMFTDSQTDPALDNVLLPPFVHPRGYQPDLVFQNAQPASHSPVKTSVWPINKDQMEVRSSATAAKNPFSAQSKVSSADHLGRKSGKPDYFAARVDTRAIVDRMEAQQKELRHASPSFEAQLQDMDSAWAATGNRFLNSPQCFPVSNVRESSPELDMTSAFQFQQAKLAASSSAAMKPVTVDQSRQAEQEHHARPNSPKRKADEISTLLPKEEALEQGPSQQGSEEGVPMATKEAQAVVETPSSSTGREPPPKKRFRFFPSLAACGTFGAGGLMVSSVVVGLLASTAPAL
ncbi:Factor arrest protein 10 [Colletotrichum plurivorum]|uniref:Factor arrest protein 10 n=1 Tax=Colletotrichum plurivorum TaxID=2175906 RepID=A0A8H6KHA8_9PEZI|nr:Factor arrest protein 10 [Colletotrichum plurivorum]